MLEKIKVSLRIRTNKLDEEIEDMINACLLDLSVGGVKKINTTDPLIQQAVKIYCKANFGLDNKDSEKYYQSYEMLKKSLALCGDYCVER